MQHVHALVYRCVHLCRRSCRCSPAHIHLGCFGSPTYACNAAGRLPGVTSALLTQPCPASKCFAPAHKLAQSPVTFRTADIATSYHATSTVCQCESFEQRLSAEHPVLCLSMERILPFARGSQTEPIPQASTGFCGVMCTCLV